MDLKYSGEESTGTKEVNNIHTKQILRNPYQSLAVEVMEREGC